MKNAALKSLASQVPTAPSWAIDALGVETATRIAQEEIKMALRYGLTPAKTRHMVEDALHAAADRKIEMDLEGWK